MFIANSNFLVVVVAFSRELTKNEKLQPDICEYSEREFIASIVMIVREKGQLTMNRMFVSLR